MNRQTRCLETLAYHVTSIYSMPVPRGETSLSGRGSCGLSADPDAPGAPSVILRWEIAGTGGDDPVWDRCYMADDGGPARCVGNRCGLRSAIIEAYAPIVAEAARRDALDAAARAA